MPSQNLRSIVCDRTRRALLHHSFRKRTTVKTCRERGLLSRRHFTILGISNRGERVVGETQVRRACTSVNLWTDGYNKCPPKSYGGQISGIHADVAAGGPIPCTEAHDPSTFTPPSGGSSTYVTSHVLTSRTIRDRPAHIVITVLIVKYTCVLGTTCEEREP